MLAACRLHREHSKALLITRSRYHHGLITLEAAEYLKKIKGDFEALGVEQVEVRIEHGQPDEVIVEAAAEEPHSTIAMTTHGRLGLGRWVLGSVAGKVIQQSDDPMLLIRATGEGNPTDG